MLRLFELAHGVRVMPGQTFKDVDSVERPARKGFDGFTFLVHVYPEYPVPRMRTLLSNFTMLHGPLNEVSIVGFEDTRYARKTENHIAAPRRPAQCTFHEVLQLALRWCVSDTL